MKNIIRPFITVSFVIIIGYVINISSPDVQIYLVKRLGADYWKFFIPILGLYIIWEIYSESGFFRKKKDEVDSKNFNLPDTTENRNTLSYAKKQVGESQLGEALNTLSSLNNTQVDEKVVLLKAGLIKLRSENIEGVNTYEIESAEINKLSKRILNLVSEIETELNKTASNLLEIKSYLTKRYTRRLEQKFAGRLPINLKMLPTHEGTSNERSETFITLSSDDINKHIANIFRKSNGRLLITGLPGAGKTNILLQLELELLETELSTLPVVLNMATWNKKFNNLNEWLLEILPAELGVSKPYAKTILKQNQLIFLFDGFDEIQENSRTSCFDAIGQFGADAKQKFVITSRIEEYKNVAKDAPVYAQIQVASLSFEQIETELEKQAFKQPEAKILLNALKTDAILRQVAEIPFYFNTLQFLFSSGKTLSEFDFSSNTIVARQNEIVERFVESELKQIDASQYKPQKAKHWLSFLAFKMTEFDKVIFELADLQYDWWKWKRLQKYIAGLVLGLQLGLIFGLVTAILFSMVYSLVVSFISSLYKSIVFGLLIGSKVGFVNGFIFGLSIGIFVSKDGFPYIDLRDSVKFSMFLTFKNLGKKFVVSLLVGLTIGLVGGLVNGLFFGLVGGLLVGLFGRIDRVLESGFAIEIFKYIKEANVSLIQITKPYQRFTASMKVLHFSILQHFNLRYLLYKKGLLPFKLVTFLNAMSVRHFLETDGATWRFRHKILQDYFAKAWVEENEKN